MFRLPFIDTAIDRFVAIGNHYCRIVLAFEQEADKGDRTGS